MTNSQVGAYVRQRRKALKLGVSDVTGPPERLARQTWYDLEAGKHPPGDITQRKVAEALDLPLDWFERAQRGEDPPSGRVRAERPAPHVLDAIREHLGEPDAVVHGIMGAIQSTLGDSARDHVISWAVNEDGLPWIRVSPLDETAELRVRVERLERAVTHLLREVDATKDVEELLDAIRAAPGGGRAAR